MNEHNDIAARALGMSGDSIDESGLSRLRQWMQDHDCAVISGSRTELVNCAGECKPEDVGKKLTPKENKQRTLEVKAALLASGFGVTEVDGRYIENFPSPDSEATDEPSLFVANLHNSPQFFDVIKRLGVKYCQDSVLLKPKGSEAVLFGTNNAEWPGFGESSPLARPLFGLEAQFTTRIRNRPISMPLKSNEHVEDAIQIDAARKHGFLGAMGIHAAGEPVLKNAGVARSQ